MAATRRRRRFHADPDRTGLIAIGLFAPFVLVVTLIAYTVQGERSRRETEARVLRDYSAIAASELKRHASYDVHREMEIALGPAMHPPGAASHSIALLAPAAFLPGAGTPLDSALMLSFVRSAFRLELPSGRLATAGAFPVAQSAEIARRVSLAAAPMGEPHRLVVDTVGDTLRVIAIQVIRDRAGTVVYGVEAPVPAIAAVIQQMLERRAVIPSALVRPPNTPSTVRVQVTSATGLPIWRNDSSPLHEFAGVDTLSPELGGLIVHVQAGPAIAEALRIGRPSPLYIPVLGALLILSAVLAVIALSQLRRGREMARLRTRFVANVSHELRTPLTQVSMFAEMLALGRDRDAGERRRYAEIIRREVARLSTLVDGVLHFARAQDDKLVLTTERRDLASEVRDAADFFTLVAAAADAKLEVVTDGELWAEVDPGALRQILLNLLDNAVKYGPRGQTVRITARRNGRDAVVTVTDEGPGVPVGDRSRIFEPYTRLDRPNLPRVAGAGIGLSVVRDLVEAHGGRVDVANGAPGLTVTLTFACADDAATVEKVDGADSTVSTTP